MNRIEESIEQLLYEDIEFLNSVRNGLPILVSGQPLRVYDANDKLADTFLTDCRLINEETLLPPFRLFTQLIPLSHRINLPAEYIPNEGELGYPAIQGFLVDGSEVVLGIRKALGFNAKSATK